MRRFRINQRRDEAMAQKGSALQKASDPAAVVAARERVKKRAATSAGRVAADQVRAPAKKKRAKKNRRSR